MNSKEILHDRILVYKLKIQNRPVSQIIRMASKYSYKRNGFTSPRSKTFIMKWYHYRLEDTGTFVVSQIGKILKKRRLSDEEVEKLTFELENPNTSYSKLSQNTTSQFQHYTDIVQDQEETQMVFLLTSYVNKMY